MRQVPGGFARCWFLLFGVVFLDQISLSLLFPVLTFIFFDKDSALFSFGSLWYGVCMALMCLSSFIVAPLLSIYSDSFGRKKSLLIAAISAFVFALFFTLGILSGMLVLVLLGSLLGGRSANVNPIAQAVIGDRAPAENKVIFMGHLQFFVSLGAFIGPILGGYFAKSFYFNMLNFSLPGIIAMVFSLLSIIIAYYYFQGNCNDRKLITPLVIPAKAGIKGIKYLFFNKSFIKIISILILIQISWSTYYQFIPIILKNTFNFSPEKVGLFVGLIALWLCLATTVGIKALRNFINHQQIIFCSACLMLLGFLCVIVSILFQDGTYSQPLLWLSGALIPMGDVMAYCAITTLLSNVVQISDQGKAMGLCSMVTALVWISTALSGGMLVMKNVNLPVIFGMIGIVLFLLFKIKEHVYDPMS